MVVGLGNPGAEYERSRHNVGFEVIDRLAQRHGIGPAKRFKNAEVARGLIEGVDALLVQPMTFMNLSGDAVGAIAGFYKIEPSDVIVVHDELDFPPGEVRLKNGGGHGGHNGVRSLLAHLGRDFVRVRVGVGKPPPGRGVDHVLSRVPVRERALLDEAVVRATEAVELVLTAGIARAMNQVNQKAAREDDADDDDARDDD